MEILGFVMFFLPIVAIGVYIGNTIVVFTEIYLYETKRELKKALLIPFYRGWIELFETIRELPDK